MFDSILFKNAIGAVPLIDIGAIAEALIFYGRVIIVGNTGTLKHLLAHIPPFLLLGLMRDKRIEFRYLSDQVGISTTTLPGGRQLHNLVALSAEGHTIERVAPEAFTAVAGKSPRTTIASWKFADLIRAFDHSEFDRTAVMTTLSDHHHTQTSVHALLRSLAPNYVPPADFQFRVHQERTGLHVESNVDFAGVNDAYHRVVSPSHSTITEAYILALLQGAIQTTYYAAALESEVAVDPVEQTVQAAAVEGVIRRHSQNETQIRFFTDVVLGEGHAIRESVNSGMVPFAKIVKLLDSADKFRDWLRRQPVEENLMKAYYREVTKSSWVEKLPLKLIRWAVFSTVGLALDSLWPGDGGKATGLAISAFDAFLMDKIIKGWTPHQFVEGKLKTVLQTGLQKTLGR